MSESKEQLGRSFKIMSIEAGSKPIRVLIVEDSPVCRELLVTILQSTPGFQVVGTTHNGVEAVRLARRLAPDLVVMDLHMPEMDGIEATRQIMIETPRPIVMVSASLDKNEREISFNAVKAGALSVMEKPKVNDPVERHQHLIHQLRLMSEVKVVKRWDHRLNSTAPAQGSAPSHIRNGQVKIRILAIAASTGGPGILAEILSRLPAHFPVPILIAQHISRGFGEGLVTWLNQQTPLEVRVARHADEPQPGQVFVAPDEAHLTINQMGLVALSQQRAPHGICPSADYLFHSVAQVYGRTAIGVILTGMGSDGAEGLRAMRQSGAHTIAQDQASSIVFGMPAVAIELGAAEQVLPANQIAPALLTLVGL
jgi:two-component system chemotaxis response regulator CheB